MDESRRDEALPFAALSHYRILSRLGAGGMGEVYLAEDTRLERKVAIKVLPAAVTADSDRVRRFLVEARAASALNHPNIVTVYDAGECAAGRYLVMEVVEGRTVRTLLAEGVSTDTLVELGAQMAKGLAAAHAAGITHRDVKPDNIMIRWDGYVKILDFGLARLGAPGAGVDSTEPGVFMGTLKYMSPEQAQGEPATAASDVYSLGMVFFEMATGRYPFAEQSFVRILNAILTKPPGEPAALNPALPAALNDLICRMLDRNPERRPAALQVAAELSRERMAAAIPTATMAVARVRERHTVGRAAELAQMRAALEGVGAGKGAIVCVAGEPGIGKSTLVEEFLSGVAEEGRVNVARGRCSERLAGTEAYLPLLGVLESLLRGRGGAEWESRMRQWAPCWHAQVTAASTSDPNLGSQAAASQDRLKREFASFLHDAGKTRPLILFLDDLHWADVSTIDILNYLASQFEGLPLLVLVTYRPSDLFVAKHPFLQVKPELQARGHLREIALGFLAAGEVAEYLALVFPGHRFPPAFARLIHTKTEGSPLFMADVVRYLRDSGVIAGEGVLTREFVEIERDLPASVRGMIERKIAQLSEEDRKLLSAASVQGYEFDTAVLAKVLQVAAEEVEERLSELERVHSFVRLAGEAEFPNKVLTLRYRFVHLLYQNALFGGLRATRRATMSREVAEALEGYWGTRRGSVANELGVLWESAREFGKAAAYFTQAARQASQLFADEEAAVLARRGLAALANVEGSGDQELMLQVVLGVALRSTRGFSDPEVGRAFSRAKELCAATAQSLRLVPVLRGLWEFYEVQADYTNALPYGRQLMELAEGLRDEGVLVVACDVMGDTSVWMGDFVNAWGYLSRGIGLYDGTRFRAHLFLYGYDTGMACCSYGSIALWNLGYAEQALARCAESNAIAAGSSHPVTKAFAAIMAGWLHRLCGDFQAAWAEGDRAVAISGEYGLPYFSAFGQMVRGWALVAMGQAEGGIADMEAGLAAYAKTGSELGNSLWMGCLAEGYATAGRREEALAKLDEALAFAGRTGEGVYLPELLRMKGQLLGSASLLKEAMAAAARQGARSFALRAAMALGDREGIGQVYGTFTEGFGGPDLQRARGMLGG